MLNLRNTLFMSASTMILASSAHALDFNEPPRPHTSTNTLELEPISMPAASYQVSGISFLGGDAYDRGFGNFKDIGRNYNVGNCATSSTLYNSKNCTYPRALQQSSRCPFKPGYYTECVCLPQFKLATCPAPKYKSSPQCDGKAERCLCPATVPLTNPNDKCTQYCDGNCISKDCQPTPNETGCQYGTTSESNGCGGTRTICKPCATGGSTSCSGQTSPCSSDQVQTSSCKDCWGTTHYSCRAKTCAEKGMKDCNGSCISLSACCGCGSGQVCYNATCCTPKANATGCLYGTTSESNGCGGTRTICKSCNLTPCSGITSKPSNSYYTTSSCTDCSGTKTINSGWACNSGYSKSGNSCVKDCSLPACSGISSKPANSYYTTSSCTDCSGTKTINSGWACNSGYYQSGSSCVKQCSLPTCSGISSKPANSYYTTSSCTDCSGTKTINSGWACNSGYSKSGSSCVKDCSLPACSGISSKPANSSYTTKSCTDCSGTKTINSGWTCNSGYIQSGNSCVQEQESASPSPSPSPSESESSTPTPSNPYNQSQCNSAYGSPKSDGRCSPEYDGSHWTGSSNGCPRDEDCDCTFPSYGSHPECAQYYSGAKCKLTVSEPMQGHSGC